MEKMVTDHKFISWGGKCQTNMAIFIEDNE